MKEAVFITGGTGFLGTEIAEKLIHTTDKTLYVLVRAENQEAAVHRLKAAWYHDEELYNKIGQQIIPVTGDFTVEGLNLEKDMMELLQEEVEIIFHAGAEVGLQKSKEIFDSINRKGTENILSFAGKLPNLKRIVHISTAYVAGQRKGGISESIYDGGDYSNQYERSKAEAEQLVRDSNLPWSICRPGMIVGNSKNGWIKNFNTIYYVLKQMLIGNMRMFPVKKSLGLNVIPVDYVAEAVVKVGFSEEAEGKIYHLTCPKEMQPKAGELVEYVREWAKINLDTELKKPLYFSIPGLKQIGLSYGKKTGERKKNSISNLMILMPYFYSEHEFDRSNTDALMGSYDIDWKDYIDSLLEFACRKNFMHQTERTVFEQAKVRRDSRRYPVTYYDVSADGLKSMSGNKANIEIEKIKNALWAWGIRKGDKIALTGINCIDYMMLDQALGLIGAVTVPIYYTTPIEEVNLLLDRSGAKWFFVGDKRIMGTIDELQSQAQLVAFSVAQEISCSKAMKWDQFLIKASEAAQILGPDPEDLATIRYTSGTTGEPKGVMFNYHQLSWMGEVLTNLLSWKGRNQEMRYLSFLPESHVVEGILASYAPYYMLTKVNYYFLNDFGALVESLPKVRPTVFFSVPRFYEKLWDQLAANKIGQKYLVMKDGALRKITAAVLKKVILKKAGLDACDQLIVGSAPISEALLRNFRALGIEIYNAYGQTEAPLITINRIGDNVIPSIGTPLPETEVSVEADGELIVTGPQVCLGYYGLETDTIKNGVLRTGDLGSIDEKGHITLFGRKKEMIITAYGKNISIPKIEEKLKNIPAVSEAVLIGENKPYCTALLWLDGDIEDLNQQIDRINEELSHPEQIRKYTVIKEPLSIQKGELTPNLKVKRGNVEAHYHKEIQEMYA